MTRMTRQTDRTSVNFTSLTDLVEKTDPRAYRLLVLRSHYRSPIEVTPATIGDAHARCSLNGMRSLWIAASVAPAG